MRPGNFCRHEHSIAHPRDRLSYHTLSPIHLRRIDQSRSEFDSPPDRFDAAPVVPHSQSYFRDSDPGSAEFYVLHLSPLSLVSIASTNSNLAVYRDLSKGPATPGF